MAYIDVIPAGGRGRQVLTYSSEQDLNPGQIVKAPYGRRQEIFAVVTKQAQKPDFEIKPILDAPLLPALPSRLIDLAEWFSSYYGIDIGSIIQMLLPARPDLAAKDPIPSNDRQTPETSLKLNPDQKQAVDTITSGAEDNWLLHGVTGSGKTAVYIELCRQALADNRSSIVLVPEIALTTQVVNEFKRHINAPILVNHSKLTAKQRRQIWSQALRSDEPVVVIGPRSSLFLPVKDPGLIVIDECHDGAYKQEQSPSYHARDVAAYLSQLSGSKLVLGSATPATQDIFLSRADKLNIIELPEPVHSGQKQAEIIDMRSHRQILSLPLREALRDNLNQQRQSLLFLNRRGSASQVLCSECGFYATCPVCSLPQSWHGDMGKLQCHWCGRKDALPGSCPECNSLAWRFLGLGTKRIEKEVKATFPDARVLRLDKDSFSAKTIDEVMYKLRHKQIDILIGTQMIAKGLDLPDISLVGVVLADTMLHIPDVYSNERTYQLLHQVAGRAGRQDNQEAKVIIQTYSPDHPAINYALTQQYKRFIDEELEDRRQLGYPPYRYALKLSCKRKTRAGAQNTAKKLAQTTQENYPETEVRGPAPAWRENVGDYWYWHLIVLSKKRFPLTEIVRNLPSGWSADIDPADFL